MHSHHFLTEINLIEIHTAPWTLIYTHSHIFTELKDNFLWLLNLNE